MDELWLYANLSRHLRSSYRTKVMAACLLGAPLPLLTLFACFVCRAVPFPWQDLLLATVATMAGTAVTLFLQCHLLRPIETTSRTLRAYLGTGARPVLPAVWTDEAGTLMADTAQTLSRLDHALEELTYYDRTTGLPNRDRLLRLLAERIQAGAPFAVCALTQHNHDRVVAMFGQPAADAVMRTLGQALLAAAGHGAAVASIGPNQLAFALPDSHPQPDAILAALPLEVATDGAVCIPELAAGMARFPADAGASEALLRAALAAVPPPGSAEPTVFPAAGRGDTLGEHTALGRDLRRALEHHEFELRYQPVVSMPSGRIVSAEALPHWRHPDHGLIALARFRPMLERNGLADAVGLWVLRAACRQLRAWSDAGLDEPRLAIKLSAGQFRRPNLADTIEAALIAHNVAPSRLEIGLTEAMMAHDIAHASALFQRLRAIGLGTVVDDFGTGDCSLGSLRNLAFDKLTIDRGFVAGVDAARDSQAICAALIALGRELEIVVQAAGAETAAEVATLRRLGCNLFQGQFFAAPLPAQELVARLRTPRAAPTLVVAG